ncbi:MAG: hypothetical protein SA339_10820 [Methanomassiliicoccus sp.]|nr:hypothetical protein [Methanomassiliicoccus sp.]
MAYKRRIVVDRPVTPEASEPEGMSWRDWLLRRYARHWYLVGAAFLDMVIFLELVREGIDAMVGGAITIFAAVIQIAVYLSVWGRNGPLGDGTEEDDR